MTQVLRSDNGSRWTQRSRLGTPAPGRVEFQQVAFSSDGELLVALEHKGGERLRWWRWRDERPLGEVTVSQGVAVQVLPSLGGLAVTDARFQVGLYSLEDGRPLRLGRVPDYEVRGLEVSPDGTRLAMHDLTGSVLLWDTRTWTSLGQLQGPQQEVARLAFSPDGKLLAAACLRGHVVVWDVASGNPILVHVEADEQFVSVAFHPEGTELVATTTGPRIQRFRLRDGGLAGTLQGPVAGSSRAAFSPDGGLLTVTRYGFSVLDARTSARVFRHEVDNDFYAANAAFSPDGTVIAWGEDDGTVGLWGLPTESR
ncbi:hypothetical protein MFUL124B02_40345 [Myxococcus fulvus 124B02]|nr:hypothetical protein MFUL124B02_40345 [Myxococcus fulvus 124B02]